jgi:hypothetical protein
MKRNRQYIRKEELADLYSALAFFTRIYDNAEAEIQTVMAEIERVYHEEYPYEPMNPKYLENRRGAGRKSRLSADDREKLLRMRKEKMPVPEIAHELGISERYIYILLRGA